MKNGFKIAIIDHVGAKAGMDYYSGNLATALADNGAQVLLCSNFDLTYKNLRCKNIFLHHSKSLIKKAFNHFSAYLKAAVYCKKNGYKHVIVHCFSYEKKDWIAFKILKAYGLDITAIVHDVESFAGNANGNYADQMLSKVATNLVVHNHFSCSSLLSKLKKIEADKISILPHGNFVNLPSAISKEQARRKLKLNSEHYYLLFFGQIKEVKGLDILIKAMSLLPSNFYLVIAGKPWKADFSIYEDLITKYDLSERIITRIGFVPDEDRDMLFHAADLLVLPYRQIFQSGVMIMAMSYMLPVIASDLPPNKEIIKNSENGSLFVSENEQDLAHKITEAFQSEEQLHKMAIAGKDYISKYHNWHVIATGFIKLMANEQA